MLRMISGMLAAAARLGRPKREGGPTLAEADRALLDWMESKSGTTGRTVFHWSTTGRGWRLREAIADEPGESTVRGAIRREMLRTGWNGLDPFDAPPPTDTQMLDWLDALGGSYTGRVLWRWSTRGYGWRLHETSRSAAAGDVRTAIRDAMGREP